MPAELAVLFLPSLASSTDALAATLASVRDEAPGALLLTVLPEMAAEGVECVSSGEALTAAELLAFARPGDRWRPGTLASRMLALRAHPRAALSVAGHVLTTPDGRALEIAAPRLPLDPTELLLRASPEPAAVLVRAETLDETALELLARPYGDAVVWSGVARRHGLVRSGELAASIPLDPARHGTAPHARTEALREAVANGDATAPGATTLRRELLRRLYVEPDPALGDVSLAALLGLDGDARATAVIEDLQWTLERLQDALAAERVRWAHGEIPPEDALGPLADAEVAEMRAQLAVLGAEVAVRDAKIRRLEAEVYRRDAIVANLTETAVDAPAEAWLAEGAPTNDASMEGAA